MRSPEVEISPEDALGVSKRMELVQRLSISPYHIAETPCNEWRGVPIKREFRDRSLEEGLSFICGPNGASVDRRAATAPSDELLDCTFVGSNTH